MVSNGASISQGNPGPSRSTVVPGSLAITLAMHPWAVAHVRISQELAFASRALPHANAAATSTALWPSARFEALEHSHPHRLITRAPIIAEFERMPAHHEVFCPIRHQKGEMTFSGDEDMGAGVMRREHSANSRGCQISLRVLALVLSRARQAT